MLVLCETLGDVEADASLLLLLLTEFVLDIAELLIPGNCLVTRSRYVR